MGVILSLISLALSILIGIPLFIMFYGAILAFFIGVARWFISHVWGFVGLIIFVAILTCIF